jgi:hypothetical protein
MRHLAASLLLLLPCGFGQETGTESRPASRVSDDTLRLLAAAVSPARIIARSRDICAFGPRMPASREASVASSWLRDQLVLVGISDATLGGEGTETRRQREWVTGSVDCRRGKQSVVLASRLSDESASPGAHASAAGASALLESARVLHAWCATQGFAELPFEVRVEVDGPEVPGPKPAPPLIEIRFGELGLGSNRDCLFVTVSASDMGCAELVPKLRAILQRWKGEKGFWSEFEILADGSAPRSDGAARVTVACTSPAGAEALGSAAGSRSSGDSCPVAGTPDDRPERTVVIEPHNAVNAARFALFMIFHAADEQRGR